MTDSEKLDLLIAEMQGIKAVQVQTNNVLERVETRIDKIEERIDKIEERIDKIEERMDKLEGRMDKLEERMDKLEERMDKLEEIQAQTQVTLKEMGTRMDKLETIQAQTQATLEGIVNKTIQVMGEGYHLIAERLDRTDIDVVKQQTELSFIMAKATGEKVDRMVEKLSKSA
jgi:chromosome segregation ATPase